MRCEKEPYLPLLRGNPGNHTSERHWNSLGTETEQNQCHHVIEAIRGDIDRVAEFVDLIFANINRNTLIRHIPHYAKRLQRHGILLLSGFYQTDLLSITQECEANGLTFHSNTQLDDWVCAKYVYSGL